MNPNDSQDIILPNYEHCILGTITSILNYYNVKTSHKTSEKIDGVLNARAYKNIIFMVLDGLGEHILKKISPDGFFRRHQIDTVTSVYPSTTTAALTAYYSGKSPYETGWIAWSQYFKEYGRALDMLSHKESYYREPLRGKPSLDVFKQVVNYESIFEKIDRASPDTRTYEITPGYSDRRGKRTLIADNINELIMHITDILRLPEDKFIFAYSDNPDGLLHEYGTTSQEVNDYILTAEEKIAAMCKDLKDDTLLIISADHGHKDIEKAHTLLDYPDIQECLIMPASLESRALTFWVKENMRRDFEERFSRVFKGEFWLMNRNEFLNEYHMLGYGEKHPKIDDFIGDYVAVSVSGSMIRLETFLAEGKPVKKSTHCGITREEMEVPVISIFNF